MTLDKKQQIRIAKVIGLIVLMYLYYNLLYVPKRKQADELKFKLANIETEVQKARSDAAYMEEMKKEIQMIEERWSYVNRKIPGRRQIPQLLDELTEAASGSNVSYVSIAPEMIQQYSAIMITNLTYEKFPIKITLQCRYRDLGDYLARLNNLNRLIKVEDIQIKAEDSIFPLLNVDLIVSTYVVS
jgi:type IV pilus assembly protein PilO